MKAFKPRQKKLAKIVFKTKMVRIDNRTQIEVRESVSDEDAREHFLNAIRDKQHHPRIYQPPIIESVPEDMP